MAIKISLNSTKIPVEIGDLKFEVEMNDEGYERFINIFNVFVKEMAALGAEEVEDFPSIRDRQKKLLDSLLGEGAFDQLYTKISCTMTLTRVIGQIAASIEAEMIKRLEIEQTKKAAKKQVVKKVTMKKK